MFLKQRLDLFGVGVELPPESERDRNENGTMSIGRTPHNRRFEKRFTVDTDQRFVRSTGLLAVVADEHDASEWGSMDRFSTERIFRHRLP